MIERLSIFDKNFERLITRFQFYLFIPLQIFYSLNSDLFPSIGGIFYGTLFHIIFFSINIVFLYTYERSKKYPVALLVFIIYLSLIWLINLLFDNLPPKIGFIYFGFIISIFNYFWIGFYSFANIQQFKKDILISFILSNVFILIWLIQGGFDLNIIFGQSNISYLVVSELYFLISGLYLSIYRNTNYVLIGMPLAIIIQFFLYSRSALLCMLITSLIIIIYSNKKVIISVFLIIFVLIFSGFLDEYNISSLNRQFSIFTNFLQDTSVIERLRTFQNFLVVLHQNPIGGDLAWHLDYYKKDGYYIHSYLSFVTSFGIITIPFLLYFYISAIKKIMIKDNFMAAPTFVGFIIMVIIAKAWMYTLSWFLIGLILSKKRYK